MELEIHEITNSEEKTRQNNHLQSFKAELKRLQHEYNLTQRRVQRSVLPTLQEKNAKFLKISNFQKNYQILAICQKIGIYQNPSICHFASEDISRNCPFFSSKMVNLPKIAIFIDGNLSVR